MPLFTVFLLDSNGDSLWASNFMANTENCVGLLKMDGLLLGCCSGGNPRNSDLLWPQGFFGCPLACMLLLILPFPVPISNEFTWASVRFCTNIEFLLAFALPCANELLLHLGMLPIDLEILSSSFADCSFTEAHSEIFLSCSS
jgi:hypothetical protein